MVTPREIFDKAVGEMSRDRIRSYYLVQQCHRALLELISNTHYAKGENIPWSRHQSVVGHT